ncbi:MAG: class I SAM-dependent methyltransferase [Gammaproteobacteria bacterium]|nr:class I SAM-dependent methyltransferase [Gammaproteobacteria bacterium]
MSIDPERLQQFIGRAVSDLAAGGGGVMISLGRRLGLYKVLAGAGPLTSVEVARRAECAERYVREWLNSQVAAEYLNYHPEDRSYEMTPEQAMVLADESSPCYIPAAWEVAASMWLDEERSMRAFKTGEGVPWGEHHPRLYCGVAAFFRNAYKGSLVPEWIPALDGVKARLEAGARVADVGTGHGHSSILMAAAFPQSSFHGIDTHASSIDAARGNAEAAGVAPRVSFEVATSTNYTAKGFDLICFFDCLHDMGDPVGAARHAGQALAPGGTIMLIEPFAHDHLEHNINPIGRLYYNGSTTLCCAHSLSEPVGLALGAQAGAARLGQVFAEAGFSHFRQALATPFNLILEARL